MLKKYLQYIILIHISYYCLKIDLLNNTVYNNHV